MTTTQAAPSALDLTGSAYGLAPGTSVEDLVRVGPGTPYGEVLRRYWQPVAVGSDATTTPKRLRILGEDLILFRTKSGTPGLLTPGCAHRGASLYFGGVEEDGIRCCYHGWKFDPQGRVLDQPCEPQGGLHKDRIRQPWYPLREYHGLLFAYLGAPDAVPAFRTFDVLDTELAAGEQIIAHDESYSAGGPAEVDFNWLQHWENVLDPFHVPILHARFSGNQFVEGLGVIPECKFVYTDHGVRGQSYIDLPGEKSLLAVTDNLFPNVRLVGSPLLEQMGPTHYIGFVVPRDDTHFVIFTLARLTDPSVLDIDGFIVGGKPWPELTPEEHREFPSDYEAQKSQGDIAMHSRENLTTTDQGVTMLRRMMGKQIKLVREGHDPVGVVRGADTDVFHVQAGNYFVDKAGDGIPSIPGDN
jgi:nitrite reductase/ring-hydroxylating ferredoxin subunit